jgi:hypothetical protein
MESLSQSVRPSSYESFENKLHIGRDQPTTAKHSARDNDLAHKGQAALDLVHRVADTMSANENRIEALLVQALNQLKSAEDRNSALTARATQAEGRASEAVKWLKRLHDEMEAKLGSRDKPSQPVQ